jgi:hypothetical protein
MPDVLRIPKFIDEKTCKQLTDWIETSKQRNLLCDGISRKNDIPITVKSRFTSRMTDIPNIPLVDELFQKIRDAVGLETHDRSTGGHGTEGLVYSYTLPGGDVYEHSDPFVSDLHTLRCNIAVSMPEVGAQLYIADTHQPYETGDLTCYLVTRDKHRVTTCIGTKPRILLMFGFLISEQEWVEKVKQFNRVHYESSSLE